MQCNRLQIYAHRYGLQYDYKKYIFMLSRTRKPEKTLWEKILERVLQTMLQQ